MTPFAIEQHSALCTVCRILAKDTANALQVARGAEYVIVSEAKNIASRCGDGRVERMALAAFTFHQDSNVSGKSFLKVLANLGCLIGRIVIDNHDFPIPR